MKKYRKKPIVIEAEQWFCLKEMPDMVKSYTEVFRRKENEICQSCGGYLKDHGAIKTLEGWHIVCPGDYIIKGVQGEFYPCKPDIFHKTYDFVEE